MQDIASLAIVGAFVSVLVQVIKANTFASPKLSVIILSVLAGTGYWFLQGTAVWEAVLGVLAFANTVYLFLIKPAFEE